MALGALGIQDLRIEFDCEQKIIEAKFMYLGKARAERVSFQDIESIFKSTDPANATPARIDKPTFSAPGGG